MEKETGSIGKSRIRIRYVVIISNCSSSGGLGFRQKTVSTIYIYSTAATMINNSHIYFSLVLYQSSYSHSLWF